MLRRILIVLAIILLAFPLGMRLAGERTAETPLGQIDFSLAMHPTGVSELYVPLADWGVEVDLFDTPLLLRADPKAINRDNLLRIADGQAGILKESRNDLSQEVLLLALQNTGAILILITLFALLAASIFSLPRKTLLLQSLAGGGALLATFFLLGLVTYSPEKIEEPTFYARGSELEQLIQVIDREMGEKQGSYASNFDRVLSGVGTLLTAGDGAPVDGKQALLFSDLHTNALALSPLEDFARNKPVFFVGDFAHQGNDAETSLLSEKVAALSQRVIAVSGNHDSALLMRSLAQEGVVVLGQKGRLAQDGSWRANKTTVHGLSVAGYEDPLEWSGGDPTNAQRIFSFEDRGPELFERERDKMLLWWDSLKEKPDVLLLHQETLAFALAEHLKNYKQDLTILTGHTHVPRLARIGQVSIVNAGAAGAGGLFGVGSENGEIAGVHFSGDALRFVDFISVDPIKGSAQAERVNARGDLCQNACSYEPGWGEVVRLGAP